MRFEYSNEEAPKALTTPARMEGEKLAKKHFSAPPVNIEMLITDVYGFTLRKLELPENVSGRADLASKEIIVNTRNNFVHQRFTMAHELGHIVLNHETRRWSELDDANQSNPDKPMEEEANAFAAGLLIPSFLLKPLAMANKNPKEASILFQVSEHSMWIAYKTYRLDKYLYK